MLKSVKMRKIIEKTLDFLILIIVYLQMKQECIGIPKTIRNFI